MARASRSRDYDIRCSLVGALIAAGVARDCIRHEITLDSSSSGGRCDLVVLHDGLVIGFEIKSGSDTLDRLKAQRDAAMRAMDYFRPVIDPRHREAFTSDNMETGLWTMASVTLVWNRDPDGPRFTTPWKDGWPATLPLMPRPDVYRSNRTCTPDMARMLWRHEAIRVAGLIGASTDRRYTAIDAIREYGRLTDVRRGVIEALRSRELNRWEETFWRRFAHGPGAPSTWFDDGARYGLPRC